MTKEAKIYKGEKTVFSINVIGKLDCYIQKNEIRGLPGPAVKTLCSQCRDPGSIPGQGTRPHMPPL